MHVSCAPQARSNGSGDEARASAARGDSARPWDSLPQDCLSLVAKFSSSTAVRRMRLVCRGWATLTHPGDAATLRGHRCCSHAVAGAASTTCCNEAAMAAAVMLSPLTRSQPTLRSLHLEGVQVAEGSLHCLVALPMLRALALVECSIEVWH